MQTFLQWLETAGTGGGLEPPLQPVLSRIHRDAAKSGVGAMPVYSNNPMELPPTPNHHQMNKKMKKKLKKESVGGLVGYRYLHNDGRGLMNNASLNYDKLDDDEAMEIEDEYLGLTQPPSFLHNQRVVFLFTPEGEQTHQRLIQLLTKASKRGVRREPVSYTPEQVVWDDGDGQIAVKL
jgi:hypothetical protein